MLFANVDASDPINVSGTNTDDGTSFSATGVTTSVDNCLIVHATAFQDEGTSDDPWNYGTPSNANLTELSERTDDYTYVSAGVNGGIYIVTGIKASAGATGSTTSTANSANNKSAVVTFALTPATENLRVVFFAAGSQTHGAGSISVYLPAGYSANDLLVMVLSGRDAVPAEPAGWTTIDTENNSTYTYNRTCYKIASSSESTVTVDDSGVYTSGQMFLFKGNDTTNPINVSTTSTDSGTTFSAGGVTTTVDYCTIVHATSFTDSATATDYSNYSSSANANLAAFILRGQGLMYASSGLEAGIYVVTGTKISAGATGDTTATADSADNYSATVTFAISPPVEAAVPEEGGSESEIIVSSEGDGTPIRKGGANSSVVVSVEGSGTPIRKGGADSTVVVSAEGDGTSIRQGGSDSTVTVSAEGAGYRVMSGGADATIEIDVQGAGAKTTFGAIYSNAAAISSGASTVNVAVPIGYVAGDLLVLVISGRNNSPALPDGWTNIGTTNNGTNIYNRTCYKFAAASESTLTVADSGTYTAAQMFLFVNVDPVNPINVVGTNTDSGTSFVASGVTTTVDNCLIVHATTFQDAGAAADTSNYGTPSNANLTQLTERADNYAYTSAGLDGGVCLVTGFKAVAGATGNTSSTADSANNYSAVVTFALTPATDNLRPEYITKGAQAGGVGNISVAVPTGYVADDLLVLVLSGRSAVPDAPAGWTNIDSHYNSTYTFVRACYKFATASESAVTVTDSGVYTTGVMLLFKGADKASPINVYTKSTDTGTTFVAGGVTTTAAKCMVVHSTSFTDATSAADTTNFSSESNANLAGLRERNDSTLYASSGVEAGIYVLTGTKIAAGATGNTSATADSANNYAATVTFAIQPPYVMPYGERGSSQEIIISAEGGGEVVESAIVEGGAEVTVTISSDGAGTKIGLGSSDSTITVSSEESGIKFGLGFSEQDIIISSEGSGTKVGTGSSDSTIIISTEGSGTRIVLGGSDATILFTPQGNGKKIAFSGSDVTVTISSDGSGIRVMSGGSEVSIVVSSDGSGSKISFSGSETEIIVSTEGSGFGSLKTGGNQATIIITTQGNGSKITWGSGEQVVIIDVDGRGRKYNPIIITAIFSHEVEVDALFDYGAEVMAIFDYEAGQTATFNCESEQTVNFVPALTIGGIYGDS